MFERECLERVGININRCEVRLKEDDKPLLTGTKAILLLGEPTLHNKIAGAGNNTLGELRGSPLRDKDGTVAIASYSPQDCVDIVDWEQKLNPLLNLGDDSEGDSDTESNLSALAEKRRHGKTNRKNWAFWLWKDCEKISKLLDNGGRIPEEVKPNYIIYPSAEEIITLLTSTKNADFYFDCETDTELNFTCFSFSFGLPTVYVVPIVRHSYTWAYERLPNVFKALAIAIRDNCIVAHNGASFDFWVLAYKYGIPIGKKSYDTMIAMHRCFPEVEKSLGHGTSLWTWQPFHKDEGNFAYGSESQARSLWEYCGKDTYTMILIKEAITRYAKTKPGLEDSINMAMDSIRPYLVSSLLGIKFDDGIRQDTIKENDRMMMQHLRMLDVLVGKDWLKRIKGNGKSPMPSSNTQCVKYFHDLLGYPVVGRSKKTTRPSLGKKNIYKLKLKVNNPVLDICVSYRETMKESGTLNFTPYKI